MISGDVLTDIDLGEILDVHERDRARRHHRPDAGREPARVRHRHHPRRRLDRAVPREAHVGSGVQRHDQHRHLRARARDLRLHPRGPHASTSPARCSRRCSPPASRCSARWSRATGRTSARSRPTCRPTRTSSTARCASTCPGFRVNDGVWLGEGAEISPDATGRRPVRHRRRAARSRPGAGWASTPCSAPTCASSATCTSSASVRPRQRLRRPRRAPPRRRHRPQQQHPQRRAHRRGRR